MSVAAAFETAISTLSLVASPTPDSTDDGIDELVKAEIAEVIQPMYTALVADVPKSVGNAASSKERRTHSFRGSTFVYGEISFQSYAIAFHKVRHVYGGLKPARGHGAVFYDLGSGSGKPVFAAALLHDFERVVGVELLTGLHGLALGLLEKWNTTLKPTLADAKAATSIEFFNDDITTFDFTDGDICFANSTCYDAGMMDALGATASRMRVGSFFITFTKRLPSPDAKWQVLESQSYPQSWGPATVYIQQKVAM